MKGLDKILSEKQKKKKIELTKTDKKVINYLLNLKGQKLVIEKMSKDTGLAKQTIYKKLEKLQKSDIIKSSWKLNVFPLGFFVVEAEAKIVDATEKEIIKKIMKHPAITSIRKGFQNTLFIETAVKELADYKEIESHLTKLGLKFIDSKIITEKLYEV